MEVDNSSYVIASSDGKTLYSIADEGVVSFRILQNGSLARLNSAPIRGMRGCHLCTDMEDKYVFVSGYHDGKTTVLSLNKMCIRDSSSGVHKILNFRAWALEAEAARRAVSTISASSLYGMAVS